jgi:hypothetical protein
MDPASLSIIARAAEPVLGILICLGAPVAIVYTVKHFKLRHRELELDAELHGKQTQARLASIEARLGVIESALGAIARNPSILEEQRRALEEERRALLEAPASSSEAPSPAQSEPARTR